MKKELIKIISIITLFGSFLLAKDHITSKIDEVPVGMKIYKKKMRKACRITSMRFSHSHTKHQWEIIHKHGVLRREAKILCTKLDTSLLTDNEWKEVYQFVRAYSRDNPKIPSI